MHCGLSEAENPTHLGDRVASDVSSLFLSFPIAFQARSFQDGNETIRLVLSFLVELALSCPPFRREECAYPPAPPDQGSPLRSDERETHALDSADG
jgi:hypothetical protein